MAVFRRSAQSLVHDVLVDHRYATEAALEVSAFEVCRFPHAVSTEIRQWRQGSKVHVSCRPVNGESEQRVGAAGSRCRLDGENFERQLCDESLGPSAVSR